MEEDACHRARNLCVFSHVQKGTQRLTHTGCVLQHVLLNAISDVTVVLGMRQSIEGPSVFQIITNNDVNIHFHMRHSIDKNLVIYIYLEHIEFYWKRENTRNPEALQ